MIETPLYMAPEQLGTSALDVDTRSDLYSLGVILYELLTGTTPIERQRLKEAAWDEIRRIVPEEEPPRPSQRLSSSDTLPNLAARRHVDPAKLPSLVRGDLDWIIMKAIPDVIQQPGLAMFRAEDQMDQVLDQRLWHGVQAPQCNALSGLVLSWIRYPGRRFAATPRRSALGYCVTAPSGREVHPRMTTLTVRSVGRRIEISKIPDSQLRDA